MAPEEGAGPAGLRTARASLARDLVVVVAIGAVGIALFAGFATYRVWTQGERDEQRPADAIVVLGVPVRSLENDHLRVDYLLEAGPRLARLILALQNPPVRQLGVLDVDTFYPEKDGFELAMTFNNLLASPTFQGWLQGERLDVGELLYTPEGKPRHSIVYVAHLSAQERMFFVTLLLESVVAWMHRQTGTRSLRAIL